MRRRGSAAPQRSWSPTVKPVRKSGPSFILRSRPMGVINVPLTAAGVNWERVDSLSFGTTRAQG